MYCTVLTVLESDCPIPASVRAKCRHEMHASLGLVTHPGYPVYLRHHNITSSFSIGLPRMIEGFNLRLDFGFLTDSFSLSSTDRMWPT